MSESLRDEVASILDDFFSDELANGPAAEKYADRIIELITDHQIVSMTKTTSIEIARLTAELLRLQKHPDFEYFSILLPENVSWGAPDRWESNLELQKFESNPRKFYWRKRKEQT